MMTKDKKVLMLKHISLTGTIRHIWGTVRSICMCDIRALRVKREIEHIAELKFHFPDFCKCHESV